MTITDSGGSQEAGQQSSEAAATPSPTPSAAAAKPKPGPVPRPGPRPSAPPAAPVVSTVPVSDPHRFGRVDPDGTVWLVTASGERNIGSWQAGTVEEGLAHFGRRFDDLATEVEILEERLTARSGDPRKAQQAAKHLLDELPNAHVIGDVAALQRRVTDRCQAAGEPPLVSLMVAHDQTVGEGYAYAVAAADLPVPENLDQHAAAARFACYLHFGATVPAGGATSTAVSAEAVPSSVAPVAPMTSTPPTVLKISDTSVETSAPQKKAKARYRTGSEA